MNPLDFSKFEVITFDCYGTLIDWETGILAALRPILSAHGGNLADSEILSLYSELEPAAQNPYRRYRDVLTQVARGFASRLGFPISDSEAKSVPDSLKNWLPFPDTNESLEKLQTRYKLAIISNIDDDLFATTARHFTVSFDNVITAEQTKAYKPALAPFQLALKRINLVSEKILHAGQSIHHDVLPAQSLGLSTVLVTRRGFGATRPAAGEPDLRVPDLQTLAKVAVG